MMIKYRVHEVAKDLNIPSKDIIDLIKNYSGKEKKHMTALTEDELNIVFEYFTQKNQVENFDKYFSMIRPVREVKKEETEKPKETAEKAEIAKEVTTPEKVIKKVEEKQAEEKQAEEKTKKEIEKSDINKKVTDNKIVTQDTNKTVIDKRPEQKSQFTSTTKATTETKPIRNSASSFANIKFAKPFEKKNINSVPFKKVEKNAVVQDRPIAPAKAKPASRVIDTRSALVDIERYNEKYDKLASEKMKTENVVQKQKITQKSQQKWKPKHAKRETEAERLKRIALDRKNKPITVSIPEEITVGELALRLKATAAEVIKKLMLMGNMASINDTIDFDTASLIALEFHAKVEKEVVVTIEERIIDDSEDADENLVSRAPVVVVMGHVDHGKTSLLDAIREENVISTEAGGITQHIGAYRVKINDKEITFLDTPGHEAFTTMRARGAQITDIAILVVAADDGIMPQTIEAINHAKAAGVSIIVAINKMDKPGANPDAVKQQLTEHELVPEEWGGDVPCIPISAKKREGIEDLLEMVNLIAEMKELKANPGRAAKGTVIEARLDKGRGPIATILVQNGTLHVGDTVVAGTCVGKVRAMTNDKGQKVKKAGPSVPVEITGLDNVPSGGDNFNAVSDDRLARELVEQRRSMMKEEQFNSQTKVTLDNLFDQMQQGEVKELKIIVKADVQGSVEAVRQSLLRLSNDEVRVNVIHGAVGAISESDVMLADASNAIIVGFNVRPDPVAAENAERIGVDIRLYRVIYTCIDEIASAMKGMLAPKYREVSLGRAECRQVYKISNVGVISGCYVLDGKIARNAQIRVVRDGIVITEDKILSLKRFKDDVKEVAQGYECGIGLEKFNDIKEGDIFEAFIMEEYRD
ncbi:MAG: Translation initiation factor IF-2 [Eubacteriales bacterium SKADARSKE-1]|nr:Translation initiation factor IF-2 [Eubacteriales bacterium SKADARSKE-1]